MEIHFLENLSSLPGIHVVLPPLSLALLAPFVGIFSRSKTSLALPAVQTR